MFRAIILKTASASPVRSLVTRSFLFRPLVRRFVAGETLDEAMAAAKALAQIGLMSTLDLLGENVSNLEEAEASTTAYIEIVERIGTSEFKNQVNISIKLTALGLDFGTDVAEANYRKVVRAAEKYDVFVRVDMEGSDYTEKTIQVVRRVFNDHKNTGTVLQSYLRRTPGDVQTLVEQGMRIRLVKGAYLEPESVAFKDKADVDDQYVKCGQTLLRNGNYPAIATHDRAIVDKLKSYCEQEGVGKDNFEWQMLYGIARDLQNGLHEAGYAVRVYVPYGSQWYPYFSRRLAERPANLFFILKSLFKK